MDRLSIITFNFDRSLEWRLFLALRSVYRLNAADAAELAGTLSLIHVHGSLGAPAWTSPDAPVVRRDRPDATPAFLLEVSQHISLAGEQKSRGVAESRAFELLTDRATEVHFLGFSYDPLNLKKLQLSVSLRDKVVYGTCLGMRGGEIRPVLRAFNGEITLAAPDSTILTHLKDSASLHA